LLLAYLICGAMLVPLRPISTDAGLFAHWTGENFDVAHSPLDLSLISPYQGLGGLVQPLGVWLNPCSLVMRYVKTPDPRVPRFVVAAFSVAVATLLLASAVGLPIHFSLAAASVIAMIAFPPFGPRITLFLRLNLTSLYLNCNPSVGFITAIAITLLAVFLYLGNSSLVRNWICVLLLPGLTLYSILCDPMYTTMFLMPIAAVLAVILFTSGSRIVFLWRLGGAAFCGVVLLSLNIHGFYKQLAGYAARAVFPNELYVEIQRWDDLTNLMSQGGAATLIALLVLISCAVVFWFGAGNSKSLAAGVGIVAVGLCGVSLLYVYGGTHWNMPLPAYFEYSILPAYVVMIALGIFTGLSRLRGRTDGLTAQPASTATAFVIGLLLPSIGLAALGAKAVRHTPEPVDSRRIGSDTTILSILQREIAIRQDGLFRGSVSLIAGVPGGEVMTHKGVPESAPFTKDDLTFSVEYLKTFYPSMNLTGLWNLHIPTLEDNSMLVTPAFHYLISRALSRPQDYHSRNWTLSTKPDPKLMASLGTRFLLTDRALSDPALTFIGRQTNEDGVSLYLYSLPNPNLGTYSPTRTIVSTDAAETLRLMRTGEVESGDVAVLPGDQLDGLVRARSSSMAFEDGGVRVRGSSEGRALIVLPVQFSNSLHITATYRNTGGKPILLRRVNLLETGVLFEGDVDFRFVHIFGPLRDTKGRAQDIADCRALGIRETGEIPYPPNYQPLAKPWLAKLLVRSKPH